MINKKKQDNINRMAGKWNIESSFFFIIINRSDIGSCYSLKHWAVSGDELGDFRMNSGRIKIEKHQIGLLQAQDTWIR